MVLSPAGLFVVEALRAVPTPGSATSMDTNQPYTKWYSVDMKTVTLSVRVPEDEARHLERLAAEAGLERSVLLRRALRRGSREVLFELAAEAYRRGEVSLSRAAEIADLSLRELILRLPDAQLELAYDAEDLRVDLQMDLQR